MIIIGGSFTLIASLTVENPIGIILSLPTLIISLIQLPKRKKQFDGLSKTDDEPLTVLKMRLAKGEITKEEFDKIKEDLK
ncbi:MAG: SHOCT domain-containing protein [Nitrosarchaeum sp.]|nr:SHOCT domain-containing protein [Nitrosarchaeum sp.]